MFPKSYRRFLLDINFLLLMSVSFYFVFKSLDRRTAYSVENLKFFDYFPSTFITEINRTDLLPVITANFIFELGSIKTTRFRIRPQTSNLIIKIMNNDAEVFSNAPWDSLPFLEDKKKLWVLGEFESIDLWFEVLDSETQKIYKTSVYKIWNRAVSTKYIATFNYNLLK